DTSVFDHGRKFIGATAETWCRGFPVARLDGRDYMELLQAVGYDNLIRRIRFLSAVQGRPDTAMENANAIEDVYKGYTYYTLERAQAERRLSTRSSGATSDGLLRSAADDAANAVRWEQTQSRISAQALDLLVASDARGGNPYETDVPYRPLYPTWS